MNQLLGLMLFKPYLNLNEGPAVVQKPKTLGNVCLHNWALHQAVNIWAVSSGPSMFSMKHAS